MVLIDGDRLADRMHQELCDGIKCIHCTFRADDGGCKVERWLDKAPIVKPKQGEWIFVGNSIEPMWECSECGEKEFGSKSELTKYCPDCGCRMKGADDED